MTVTVTSPLVLITGGSRGIGAGVGAALARRDWNVVMVARESRTAARTLRALKAANPRGEAHFVPADLSRMGQVRDLAAALEPYGAIDLLIHGAATVPGERILTPDGFETQWAVNHLAPFLLSALLEQQDRGPKRTMTIASKLHRNGRIEEPGGLFAPSLYDRNQVYADTKLANVLFTRALANRLAGRSRTAFCLHPGAAATSLLQSLAGESRLERMRTRLSRTVRRSEPWGLGACVDEVTRLAIAEEAQPENGSYWEGGSPTDPSAIALDRDLAERLWSASSTALVNWLNHDGPAA